MTSTVTSQRSKMLCWMLAEFNATMRDEVDLDALQAALVRVVQETMQPKAVGLWVQEPAHNQLSGREC